MLKSERSGCLEASAAKMRRTKALLVSLVTAFASARGAAAMPSETARDWLIKQVCVDAADVALSVDPYPACPAGTSVRKLRFGEALPYHNIDQTGAQQNDALPGRDRAGREIYFHTFDYAPFGVFNLYDGSDGFDTYVVRDGWVSSPDTRDGGGFGTVFFGGRCSLGSGWVYFPEKGFLSGGEVRQPIAVRYWEQSGEDFPGSCPAGYSTDTLTSWKFVPAFPFGGLGGALTKPMDAMVSHHGFRDGKAFLANGHMEVFYFTEQYGLTRWEVWTPIAQGGAPSSDCAGTGPFDYRGMRFIVRYCHDWSRLMPAVPPQPVVWPLPLSNLLAHFHFGEGFEKDWHATAIGDPSRHPCRIVRVRSALRVRNQRSGTSWNGGGALLADPDRRGGRGAGRGRYPVRPARAGWPVCELKAVGSPGERNGIGAHAPGDRSADRGRALHDRAAFAGRARVAGQLGDPARRSADRGRLATREELVSWIRSSPAHD
jgi:hypothetical protein